MQVVMYIFKLFDKYNNYVIFEFLYFFSSASILYADNLIDSFEILVRKSVVGFIE